MDGRINSHRLLISIFTRDAFIHIEQVAVSFADFVFAQSFDRIGKIQVHTTSAGANSSTFVAHLFGRT